MHNFIIKYFNLCIAILHYLNYATFQMDEKFKKLANSRVNKALNTLKLIGNLSNRSIYTYSDEQAKQIINALENELKVVKNKFSNTTNGRNRKEFELE